MTYGGDAAGSVAIWVDDGQVSNIVITHKVVSGTVTRNGNTISDITVSAVSSDGLPFRPKRPSRREHRRMRRRRRGLS